MGILIDRYTLEGIMCRKKELLLAGAGISCISRRKIRDQDGLKEILLSYCRIFYKYNDYLDRIVRRNELYFEEQMIERKPM